MVRFLAIGDSHIPRRAKNIPIKIREKLDELARSEPFDYTFFTGDLIKYPELIEFLNLRTEKNLFIVIGNMDYFAGNRDAPIYQELMLSFLNEEKITIGLTHGSQVKPRGDHLPLEKLAIKKKYNILISGHTHKEEIFLTKNGILLLNPGSVTGAWSFVASRIPSFILIHINEVKKDINVNLIQFNSKSDKISEYKSYFIFKNNQIHYKY